MVDRLRAGDESAFVALIERYQPRMLRLAEMTVGSRAVAEEVTQETWLAVIRGVERFEGRSTLKTWLFHILLNRARSTAGRELRAGRPERDVEERFDRSGALGHTRPSRGPTGSTIASSRSTSPSASKSCCRSCPTSSAKSWCLRDLEGLSSDDVAALVGVTDGHQRVLLHRGRAQLRQLLSAEMRAV